LPPLALAPRAPLRDVDRGARRKRGEVTLLEVPVELTSFFQHHLADSPELGEVRRVAHALLEHLRTPGAEMKVLAANQPGAPSQGVQDVFVQFARELGFVDERVGLFAGYESAVRPDYYLPLGESGILIEVERGKTTINNMDFLDFWKCHLCEHAHYLFLLVPKELRQNPTMSPRREYAAVLRRLEPFFRRRNYTNVRGLFVFGY
jgi:hypothetical protein